MKNKYALAIAALASSAACMQAAQAQTNVTVYGRLNVDIESIRLSNPTAGASGDVSRMSSNSSRLGFRGTEDLGGDLKAIFQIESSVNPDAGTGTLAGRDSFVGLAGNWGKVRLGIMDDPFKGMGEFTDRFKGTGLADDGTIGALGGSGGGFTRRQVNSLRYDSADFGGFKGELQYGLDDEAPVNPKTSLSLVGKYTTGKLKLGAGYQQHKNFLVGRLDKAYRLGAKYDFGPFDIGGGVIRLDYDLPSGNITRDYWTISTGIKVGSSGVINVKYGSAGNGKGSAPNGAVTQTGSDSARIFKGPNSGAKLFTVGYEHNLSKRTQLYTYYTRISNDANANYRFGTNGLNIPAAGPGASPSAFVLGVSHDF